MPCVTCDSSSSVIQPTPEYKGGSCDITHYKTKPIGNQLWMAENLNCYIPNSKSKCYDNDTINCKNYGRLYDWETAKIACPIDWHLPKASDWQALTAYIKSNSRCSDCEGKHLKAKSGWKNKDDGSSGNGEDTYGFSALPGGNGVHSGDIFSFLDEGSHGIWWGKDEYDSKNAYSQRLSHTDSTTGYSYTDKNLLFSVRCLHD